MHKRRSEAFAAAINWFRNEQIQTDYTDATPLVEAIYVSGYPWPDGLASARLQTGHPGHASIWLAFNKPPARRKADEPDITEFRLEPEAVFVLMAHCFAGFRLGVKESKGHDGLAYNYLGLFKGKRSVRFQRFIANTRSDRLGLMGRDDFHDLRTPAVVGSLSRRAAANRYGPQKKGAYAMRQDFITLATADFDYQPIPTIGTKREYRALLNDSYKLLDLRKTWL